MKLAREVDFGLFLDRFGAETSLRMIFEGKLRKYITIQILTQNMKNILRGEVGEIGSFS